MKRRFISVNFPRSVAVMVIVVAVGVWSTASGDSRLLQWYTLDVSGPQFRNVVHSGRRVVAIEKVYVRDNGEHRTRKWGALGVFVYGSGGEITRCRLFGPRNLGGADEYGPRREWDDNEGIVYRGFGLFNLDQVRGGNFRMLIEEGDHGLTGNDIIFDRVISTDSLTSGRVLEVRGSRSDHATVWLRYYDTYPEKGRSSVFRGYRSTPTTVGRASIEYWDPVDYRNGSKVLTGLFVNYGKVVDSVIPYFREVRADGSLGRETTGLHHGGPGGGYTCDLSVPPGYVVTGVIAKTGNWVGSIQLVYREWKGDGSLGRQVYSTPQCGPGGDRMTRIVLEADEAAVGIHGMSGRVLDRIGLVAGQLR